MAERFHLRRLTSGDYALAVALTALALALAYPTLRARSFERALRGAVQDVEALHTGATSRLAETGVWPPGAATGEIVQDFVGLFPGDTSLVRGRYTIQWQRWEVVDYVEAPPSLEPPPVDAPPADVGPDMVPVVRHVAGIMVHSGEESLLAGLLQRFGPEASFVRDSIWTLILPGRGTIG